MRKKLTGRILCLACSAVLLAGCGNETASDSTTAIATPTPTVEATETPTPTPEAIEATSVTPEPENGLAEGQMYSYLTGEPIDESIGSKRPFAVMINNLAPAVPQSGVVSADIVYEAQVEGSITRMLAVFQDPSGLEKIGPVRSARHYFVYLSDDNDATFAHIGWSPMAEQLIKGEGRVDINGSKYDGSLGFFRTSDRVAPHNCYVTGQGLSDIAAKEGETDRSYPADYQPNLLFNTVDTQIEGEEAGTVYVPFAYDDPYFTYNTDDGLYYRYEYGQAHVDKETGEQLKFKNIIIQQVDEWMLPDEVHMDMYLTGEGAGYYFTDGKVMPITWKKDSEQDKTHYYDQNGNQLAMNPGKTMFEICPKEDIVQWAADSNADPSAAKSIITANTQDHASESTVRNESTLSPAAQSYAAG